ncbi:MAG: serine/threonine-protein kinase [Acidobacteriota bacterium]
MKRLGKYEVLQKIGEGGFGVVYRGRDPLLDRIVAIKTCTSSERKVRKRFFREAEISGRLRHPNVVTVHDFGVEDELPYLVQEFLPGADLHHFLEAEPDTSLGTRVRFLRGIAEGLRYAHSAGVIHRDVKPANVRVIDGRRVKVMDFGIAKISDQESELTDTGLPLGTVAYLSPEQLSEQTLDARCDQFAFGVLAFEVLAGHRPFRATSIHALFYQILSEATERLDQVDEDIPKELADLVERCLEKGRDDRYGDFGELIDDLEPIQSQIPGAWDRTEQAIFLDRLRLRAREVDQVGERARHALGIDDAPEAAEAPEEETRLSEAATASTAYPQEIASLTTRVLEQLDSGALEGAALAFVQLEQKARGASFLDEIRQKLDAGFKNTRRARR